LIISSRSNEGTLDAIITLFITYNRRNSVFLGAEYTQKRNNTKRAILNYAGDAGNVGNGITQDTAA